MTEPMRRPNFRDAGYKVDSATEGFLMDFENACLEGFGGAHPTGPNRYKDPAWAAHIKANVFPYHSDIDWLEYVEWVSGGGGDDWFQEEEELQTPVVETTRCSGCLRDDDFCRCGSGGIWWGM